MIGPMLLYVPMAPGRNRLKWPFLAFAWVTGYFSMIQWVVMSSGDSHQKPSRRAQTILVGQAHRDNAVLCKGWNQTTLQRLVRDEAWPWLSTARILVCSSKEGKKRPSGHSCGPKPCSEKQRHVRCVTSRANASWLALRSVLLNRDTCTNYRWHFLGVDNKKKTG